MSGREHEPDSREWERQRQEAERPDREHDEALDHRERVMPAPFQWPMPPAEEEGA